MTNDTHKNQSVNPSSTMECYYANIIRNSFIILALLQKVLLIDRLRLCDDGIKEKISISNFLPINSQSYCYGCVVIMVFIVSVNWC